jgi:hypothetical protein
MVNLAALRVDRVSVYEVPRRNVIPLVLLAVLAALTGIFAGLAATAAPDSSSLVVQNATGETFGYPDGATNFSMHLISTVSSGLGTGNLSQVRLVDFAGPDRMAVYQTGTHLRLIAVLNQAAINCALDAYTAMVAGTTPWTTSTRSAAGSTYRRTESLAEYSARVPRAVGTECTPRSTVVHGTVLEVATVRSGFLVTLHLTIVVPPQTFNGGTLAARGIEGETLQLLQINQTPVGSLGS